jgi:thioredoxin 1
MTRYAKGGIIAALVLAVAAVAALRQREHSKSPSVVAAAAAPAGPLPRLVDLGAGKCIPCKAMAPILDELRKDFAGQFEVVFIDVWQNPQEGEKYDIQMIPTQIFYDAAGKELFRHQGFFSRDDILATWKANGFSFNPKPARPATTQ